MWENLHKESPILIDLFCGAGGMSLGFERAGFKLACAVDFHEDPLETFLKNRFEYRKDFRIINEDIKLLQGKNIKNEISKVSRNSDVDVIIGGPPCQGFSLRGKRKKNDPRNNLVYEYLRIIREIKPKIFVFENVSGLLSKNNEEFMYKIIEKINNLGYHYGLDLLNSSDYGVPQNRKRLIIIGCRSGEKIIFPKKSDMGGKKKIIEELNNEIPNYDVIPIIKTKKVTNEDAIGDIAYSEVKESPINYKKQPKTIYQNYIRNNSVNLYNHITTRHRASTVSLFEKFKQGDSMKDIPEKYRNKRSSVYRMWQTQPARTITSCNEDFIHYSLNRIITIREMARLQSYPDDYIFYGTPTTGGDRRKVSCCQVQQVGNSVPPLLAQAIAEGVLKMLNFSCTNSLKDFILKLDRSKNS